LKEALGNLLVAEEEASKSWYKLGALDIGVVSGADPAAVPPLSQKSSVVSNLKANNQVLLYVRPENAARANEIVREVAGRERNRQTAFGFAPGTR
jgi:hypothetical protein